jgi:hypothetical protein
MSISLVDSEIVGSSGRRNCGRACHCEQIVAEFQPTRLGHLEGSMHLAHDATTTDRAAAEEQYYGRYWCRYLRLLAAIELAFCAGLKTSKTEGQPTRAANIRPILEKADICYNGGAIEHG